MKISIFGMGYVGTVSGVCLASRGHDVIGVDVNPLKVRLINEGTSPIIERDLPEMLRAASESGRFHAIGDPVEAVLKSNMSFVCVGTPGNGNGSQNQEYARRVCEEIGEALRVKKSPHVVVIRSTLMPGSTESLVIPALEAASGLKAEKDFFVCFNPEFMREGSSVHDFFHPPMTVIGGPEGAGMDAVSDLYADIEAPLVKTNYRAAETIKYVCNVFHALKIAFANEIGTLCKAMGVDSHEVMNIVCQDRKLNISEAYLKPGFAFGGSCLPKDLRALTYTAKKYDLEVPLLNSILRANDHHIRRAVDLICGDGRRRIGVIGLSFKPGTDDLRESPMVSLVETLIGRGYPVRIYDRNISLARLTGSNRDFIEHGIPHIASILTDDLPAMLNWAEVVVAGNKEDGFRDAISQLRREHVLIDLARVFDPKGGISCPARYEGVCW